MDRKSSRSSRSRPSRDGKKFNRPRNKYEIEKGEDKRSTQLPSTSKRKLLNDTECDVNLNISYKILNFFSVFTVLSDYISCKKCGSNINFTQRSIRGLGFKLVVNCEKCDPVLIDSCPLIDNAYEINRRFILAMRLIGVGLSGAERFCAFMDLPSPMFQSFYDGVVKQIRSAAKTCCDLVLAKAAKEEVSKEAAKEEASKEAAEEKASKEAAKEKVSKEAAKGEVSKEAAKEEASKQLNSKNIPEITVSTNGSWKKSGFASLFSISSLIGHHSNKIVDVTMKSSFCKTCDQINLNSEKGTSEYNDWLEEHAEFCSVNLESSDRMKVDGIKEMLERSEALHNVRYVRYMGDDDDDDDGDDGDDDTNGLHSFADETTSSTLQKDAEDALLPIRRHKDSPLSNSELLDDCVGRLIQNDDDSFNFDALVWQIAPESNSCSSVIVEIALYISAIIFNEGAQATLKIMDLLGIKVGPTLHSYCADRDTNRIKAPENRMGGVNKKIKKGKKTSGDEEKESACGSGLDSLI